MPPRAPKDKITHHAARVQTARQAARALHRKLAAEARRAARAQAQNDAATQ